MAILEFVLPEGSAEPCPNACGGLTEDSAGGPCKACWAKVPGPGSDDDEWFECAGCWSQDVSQNECHPECLAGYDHIHLRCADCGYLWTERLP